MDLETLLTSRAWNESQALNLHNNAGTLRYTVKKIHGNNAPLSISSLYAGKITLHPRNEHFYGVVFSSIFDGKLFLLLQQCTHTSKQRFS
jgi:hypothetical protein